MEKSYDVIVIGGGTAGVPAALAAARGGARTALIESMTFLGGTETAACVTPMMSCSNEQGPLVTGLHEAINQQMKSLGAGYLDPTNGCFFFDPEMLKIVLDDMCIEAGVDLLFGRSVTKVEVADGKIQTLTCLGAGRKAAVSASVFIDASGDAKIAQLAGCPFETGRKIDGRNQPVTLRFNLANVNVDAFVSFVKNQPDGEDPESYHEGRSLGPEVVAVSGLKKVALEAKKRGLLTPEDTEYFQLFSMPGRPGEFAFNSPDFAVDTTNPDSIDHVLPQSRQAIARVTRVFRELVPGFESCYLERIAPMLGVRESRRINGHYQLTLEDLCTCRKFEDSIARANYPVDIHKSDQKEKFHDLQMKTFGPDEYYTVPYRSLVPLEPSNLLVAGRCLSADFEAQSAVRIQATCRAMGEAAGVAAALCIQNKVLPGQLSGQQVHQTLESMGALC